MEAKTEPQPCTHEPICCYRTITALPFYCQFTAGALAGVTELLTLYPLDVVKTRMQLQGANVTGAEKYNNMMDCFRKIVASEG